MKQLAGREMCDCWHLESTHSAFTRGFGTDSETGKTYCYDCCLAREIAYLKQHEKLTAYISGDGKFITTWSGEHIARITGHHIVDFGFCRNQWSFDAIMSDGTKLSGRGPGEGMFCRLKLNKGKAK